MTWREYLSDRGRALLLHLISMSALYIFLLTTGTQKGILIIILIVWLLGLSAIEIKTFIKRRTYIQELEAIMEGLDQKYLFAECAPKPKSIYDRYLFDLLKRSGRDMLGAVSKAQISQREYREYIESWVHEIKTPITAAQLICRNEGGKMRSKLLPELAQIDNHVERALFYARAESPEQDFIIRRVELMDIISQALENHRTLLIQKNICVEMKQLEFVVYTDEKWTVFLFGQLLQNAARYHGEEPKIWISARMLESQVQVSLSDNGIGIPVHEISRIFDRGFTGSNGRSRGGATGMGLYLCRKLAGFLQIDIAVHAKEGAGAEFVLTFPAQDNLSKL